MRVIRGDIIGSKIKFNVDAQTYRRHAHGFTRLDTAAKVAAALGFEIDGMLSMQVAEQGERFEVTIRGKGGLEV